MTAHATPASFRNATAALLAAFALPAAAIGLGELQVHSALDEPLDATVALKMAPDSRPRADCFSLGRARAGGLPAVPRAAFSVEPDGAGWRLRIRTRAAVGEPALQMRLDSSCEGRDAASRDYQILVDPRPAQPAPPAMRTLPGDSLASLAAAIHPGSRAVREAYVLALRKANPAVAGVADGEALAPGTAIVLPDLRRFSLSLAMSPAAPRPALPVVTPRAPAMPAATPPGPPAKAAPAAGKTAAPASAERGRTPAPPYPAKAAANGPAASVRPREAPKSGRFVLRLSAPEMDLGRSRGVDDRTRARLRERLLVLDADDQVSALLAMRDSLQTLEGRVAALQLKLSTLPATPATLAAPKPGTAASSKPEIAPAPAAVATPAPKPEAAASSKPDTAPAPAAVATPAAKPEAAPVPPPAVRLPAPAPAPVPAPAPATQDSGPPTWLWGAFALLLAAIAAIGWLVRERWRKPAAIAFASPAAATDAAAFDESAAMAPDGVPDADASAPSGHRFVADSDASLATSVAGADPAALRRRYIEERFPEFSGGADAPGEPDAVVKAARLFYEDGALARAVELLQYAVEERPASLKPWLALFEIFRLEHLPGEFAELAGRFREHHGASDYWRKVQFIGRELEPGNPLYQEGAFRSLETIGFAAARQGAPVTFDPLAENWLNAPMDFTTDALAASLRSGILSDAGVVDTDLVADPMPALRNAEMFNVA